MSLFPFLKPAAFSASVALVVVGVWFGRNIPFATQWPLYEALRTTAAIIFAVVGAWLAIIYPERLRFSARSADDGRSEMKSGGEGIGRFFTPIANSTAILCLILLFGIIAPILRQIPFLTEHAVYARAASYGVLVSLTLWQLWTVILTLIPADAIKRASDREDRRRAKFGQLKRHGSTHAKPSNET
ncbi:hypothetical protein [Achromobacter insolitus]|uniref:hypothetical protein n=1 Tax=Achromobacter insolitus TaxID=217204 RepID=UPI0007C29496|nr:hypothetical protein [Achromobacter insolitus]OAD12272.1 hypothetical protein A3839_22640 [Achromobacter insolitus]